MRGTCKFLIRYIMTFLASCHLSKPVKTKDEKIDSIFFQKITWPGKVKNVILTPLRLPGTIQWNYKNAFNEDTREESIKQRQRSIKLQKKFDGDPKSYLKKMQC